MKYQFIHKQRLEFPVRVLCEVLEVKKVAITPGESAKVWAGRVSVVKKRMKS